MFNSILTWEQMAKQWILLNFLVRSKNYTFSETLEHYKRLSIVLNFFSDILWIFRTKILWHVILWSVKISYFPKCEILYINRNMINYWWIFTERRRCLRFGFSSYGVWNKNYVVIICGPSSMKIFKIWPIWINRNVWSFFTKKFNFSLTLMRAALVFEIKNNATIVYGLSKQIINCIFQALFYISNTTLECVLIFTLLWIVRTITTLIAWE